MHIDRAKRVAICHASCHAFNMSLTVACGSVCMLMQAVKDLYLTFSYIHCTTEVHSMNSYWDVYFPDDKVSSGSINFSG